MAIMMFLPIIIMLITFGLYIWQGVWVAIDSRKRGEEYWWIWSIASFIAFPIGIIVYALVSRSDRRRCNNCGKEVPQNLNLCPYCGQRCGHFCPSCGQNVQPGWKFCPNCTNELPEEISKGKNIKNNKPIIIIVSVIIILAILFIGIFVASFAGMIGYVGKTEVYNEEISMNATGYMGGEYKEKYSNTRSYGLARGTQSISYEANVESGEVIIRGYDSEGNLLGESEPIKSNRDLGIFMPEGGAVTRIEIEYKDFKGSFYYKF